HMFGQRYYARTLGGGLIDLFVLDSERMLDNPAEADAQIAWLEGRLEAGRAPWKIVALHSALKTTARDGRAEVELGERLLPILEEHGVDVVAWAGERRYERLGSEERGPILINAG